MLLFVGKLENILLAYYILICAALGLVFIVLPVIIAPKYPNKEKLSPYECGFQPFSDARFLFDIQFYLIAILFIIFDIEVVYLLPWLLSIKMIGIYGFLTGIFFILLLFLGFYYEWISKALDWN